MKKTLFTLFTAINLALLYCPAAFALTEDEAAAAVDAQDVYKRQVVSLPGLPTSSRLPQNEVMCCSQFGSLNGLPNPPLGAGAVSYTHLDVYKRQVDGCIFGSLGSGIRFSLAGERSFLPAECACAGLGHLIMYLSLIHI